MKQLIQNGGTHFNPSAFGKRPIHREQSLTNWKFQIKTVPSSISSHYSKEEDFTGKVTLKEDSMNLERRQRSNY